MIEDGLMNLSSKEDSLSSSEETQSDEDGVVPDAECVPIKESFVNCDDSSTNSALNSSNSNNGSGLNDDNEVSIEQSTALSSLTNPDQLVPESGEPDRRSERIYIANGNVQDDNDNNMSMTSGSEESDSTASQSTADHEDAFHNDLDLESEDDEGADLEKGFHSNASQSESQQPIVHTDDDGSSDSDAYNIDDSEGDYKDEEATSTIPDLLLPEESGETILISTNAVYSHNGNLQEGMSGETTDDYSSSSSEYSDSTVSDTTPDEEDAFHDEMDLESEDDDEQHQAPIDLEHGLLSNASYSESHESSIDTDDSDCSIDSEREEVGGETMNDFDEPLDQGEPLLYDNEENTIQTRNVRAQSDVIQEPARKYLPLIFRWQDLNARTRRIVAALGCCILLLIFILVPLLPRDKGEEVPSTTVEEVEEGPRLDTMTINELKSFRSFQVLEPHFRVSEYRNDTSSFIWKTFVWLVVEDESGIAHASSESVPDWRIQQRYNLAHLYLQTSDVSPWSRSFGFLQPINECEWKYPLTPLESLESVDDWIMGGVATCNDDGEITELNLSGIGLSGGLPTYIGLLSSLTSLDLSGNQFKGTIPAELGNLSNLLHLNLSILSRLAGSIPSDFAKLTTLKSLDLTGSPIYGPLPSQFFEEVKGLEVLNLGFTNIGKAISGLSVPLFSQDEVVPTDKLRNLTTLNLERAKLSGYLPSELALCTKLEYLHLSGNSFDDMIPESYANLTSIKMLDASENSLTGILSSEFGRWVNLEVLNLYGNQLSGDLPSEFAAWSNLRYFEISANAVTWFTGVNGFSGILPSEYGSWTNMQTFAVAGNSFTGSLPSTFGRWTELEVGLFSSNLLAGWLPTEYAAWTKLQGFGASENDLIGTLPWEYQNWTELIRLDLGSNSIYGTLPSNYSSWRAVKDINLSANRLNGNLSDSFEIWTNIEYLRLSDNFFTGLLPLSYGPAWSNIQSFSITENCFDPLIQWDASFEPLSVFPQRGFGECEDDVFTDQPTDQPTTSPEAFFDSPNITI